MFLTTLPNYASYSLLLYSEMDSFTLTIPKESVPTTEERPGGGAGGYCVISKTETVKSVDMAQPGGGGGHYCIIA